MPVYEFTCAECGAAVELIRGLGETDAPACDACGAASMQRVFSRVAVRYGSWGFTSTDSLVNDTRGKDFKALRSKAEQISDE
jgi:putative FmdB family regulatory protein